MADFTRIATLDNEVEAQLLDQILTNRNIDHAIISHQDPVFEGINQMAEGWGAVEAPESSRELIVDLLEGLRTGETGAAEPFTDPE
jgi:hypothetical protein